MKNITFFLLIFLAIETHAQNYMISFAGTGAATTVDSVHVQNLTQCTDTSLLGNATLNLSSTVGLDNFAEVNSSINVYPNPAAGNFIVSFTVPTNGNTSIEIYDAVGKSIYQQQQFLSKGQHSFNIKSIGSGAYLVKILSDKYTFSTKILSNSSTESTISMNEITTDIPVNAKIKGSKNTIAMQYNTSDRLKFTGYSGIYKTIFMLVPTQSQTVTFNFILCTDADGNNYAVVKIDTVVWMEENLMTTKFQNGIAIAHPNNIDTFDTLFAPAYCYPNNDHILVPVYGELYNWYAVDDPRNICPNGWHVPTDSAWIKMITFLGGFTVAGGKIKENCSTHWASPNTGATNESGFTALPAGGRQWGFYYILGEDEDFWSSTPDIGNCCANSYAIDNTSGYTGDSILEKSDGFTIRCIKN